MKRVPGLWVVTLNGLSFLARVLNFQAGAVWRSRVPARVMQMVPALSSSAMRAAA